MNIEIIKDLLEGLSQETNSSTFSFTVDSEDRAANIVEKFKNNQLVGNYILAKSNIVYKSKKDRKTGEIVEEYWIVTVTMKYEVM